jgi:hypothetical protein
MPERLATAWSLGGFSAANTTAASALGLSIAAA